jgi:hypothetical protein
MYHVIQAYFGFLWSKQKQMQGVPQWDIQDVSGSVQVKILINICPKDIWYEDMAILQIKVTNRVIVWITFILLVLFHITYIYKNFYQS